MATYVPVATPGFTPEPVSKPTPWPAPGDWAPGEVPEDPAANAPPLDPGAVTVPFEAFRFLWTGPDAVQRGVEPGAIDPERMSVVHGQVVDRWGEPLPGVDISVREGVEFGTTRTREDGRFDLVVNGGRSRLLRFEAEGYLPAQRRVSPRWQREITLGPVVLVEPDPRVTEVVLGGGLQVAEGSEEEDGDGRRRLTLLIPGGTEAWLDLPGLGRQPLDSLSIQLTEYTVGESGPAAMPGDLPAASGYTFAFEVTVGEAWALGTEARVVLNRPVPLYNENFLDFPVGTTIPVGWYDPSSGQWEPSDSGVVLEVLGVTDGVADLDLTGTGRAASEAQLAAWGIGEEERAVLAERYPAGTSLWRVALPHFSSWDSNLGFYPPADARAPSSGPGSPESECDPCAEAGSVLDVHNRVLGESIPLAGTGFSLRYRSDRVPGRRSAYRFEIPVTEAEVPGSLKRVEVELDVAGQHHTWTFGPEPGQWFTFEWDGLDGYGREVLGVQVVNGATGYVYDGVYEETETFGYSGTGTELTADATREEVTLWKSWEARVGTWDARAQGLGGWTLDVHHAYDPNARVLYYGDGRMEAAWSTSKVIDTVIGEGDSFYEGAPASEWKVVYPHGVVGDGEGGVYVSDYNLWVVLRLSPDGTVSTYAGTLKEHGYWGDGGPADEAGLWNPLGLDVGPDGSLYIADSRNNRIRRVRPDGIIETVAGNGETTGFGDESPATEAQLYWPADVDVDEDGNLYIADTYHHLVRYVGPDGIMHTLAGTGVPDYNGDGGEATRSHLNMPSAVALGPDRLVYIADARNCRVRRVTSDGRIETVAGREVCTATGDGGPATEASIGIPVELDFGADGSLYITDDLNGRIRRVRPDGIIETVAGGPPGDLGDGGPPASATLERPGGVWEDDLGELWVADTYHYRLRHIGWSLVPYTGEPFELVSEDGTEVYRFGAAGRHEETVDALTGVVLFRFHYDETGLLSGVEDRDGHLTRVERDESGHPTAVVSPWGVRTDLETDSNGYLSGVRDPTGAEWRMSSTADGLLVRLEEPSGGETGLEALGGDGAATLFPSAWTGDPSDREHLFTYDELGYLVRDEAADGFATELSWEEDETGYEATTTTALGRERVYRVEPTGPGSQYRETTGPDGLTIRAWLAPDHERVVYPDGTDVEADYGPDPRWSMGAPVLESWQLTLPSGLTALVSRTRSVFLSDPLDPWSLESQTDEVVVNGNAWQSAYDAGQRTWEVTTPEGRQARATLDENGRVVSVSPPGVTPVAFAWDAAGRLEGVVQGDRRVDVGYDERGNVSRLTDGLGRTVRFEHDEAGRLRGVVYPDGRRVELGLDGLGWVTRLTPASSGDHGLPRTPFGALAGYLPPEPAEGEPSGGAPALPEGAISYEYNADRQWTREVRSTGEALVLDHDPETGRLSRITHPDGWVEFTYGTESGQVESIESSDGVQVTWTWDGPLMTRETWTGLVSGEVQRTWNRDLRVASETVAAGDSGEDTGASDSVAYIYDQDGLLARAGDLALERDLSTGRLERLDLAGVSDLLTWNDYGEVSDYEARAGGEALWAWHLDRDVLGRVVRRTEEEASGATVTEYVYDSADRLSEVKEDGVRTWSFTYDVNGNRVATSGTEGEVAAEYDGQDRLVRWGVFHYAYDAHGRLTTRTDTSTGEETGYRYDALGALREVTLPDGRVVTYDVDGLGRRIARRVDGVSTHGYLYRGAQVVAVLDADGRLAQRFVYGTRSHVPDYLIQYESGGTAPRLYRLETDHLGSVRRVVDAGTGEVVQRLEYDPWGKVLEDTAPGLQPFGFAGGLYDPATGLVRFGVRDYDPGVGRWTAKDPILFAGGDPNLYGYVLNDPVNGVDPWGTAIETAWDAFNVSLDIASFSANVAAGNYPAAAVDAAGLVIDAAAALTPFVPGGAGAAIEFYRGSKLGRNLYKVGRGARQGIDHCHHIVPKGAKKAQQAREALQRLGVDLDDAINGVALPKEFHQGVHTDDYYKAINEASQEWTTFEKAAQDLEGIRNNLLNQAKEAGYL